jgi:putative nucleotidyltransferase with HDIG domain
MKQLIERIRNLHEEFFKFFLFFIALVILVYLFPREGKFKYEYQKGKPWLHETLYATFDYPIYKLQSEIEKEKEALTQISNQYFIIDESIKPKAISLFRKSIYNYFEDSLVVEKISKNGEDTDGLMGNILSVGVDYLTSIYNTGVISTEDIERINQSQIILVNSKGMSSEAEVEKLNTIPNAYKLAEQVSKELPESLQNIFLLSIEKELMYNLHYDKNKTEHSLKSNLEKLSPISGKIQKGEEIITTGTIVNEEKNKILDSYKVEYENKYGKSGNLFSLIGQIILIGVVLLTIFLFLRLFRHDVLSDNLKIAFLLLLIILFVLLSKGIMQVDKINLYIVPFCILPLIVRTFFDARLAQFIHICAMLLIGYFAPNPFEFFLLQFLAGVVSIFSVLQLQRRSQLFNTSVVVFIIYSVTYFSLFALQEGAINNINYIYFGWFAGSALLTLLAYPLIYIFEKIFGFISDVTLMELADTNNSLLRKLAMTAPGTFQHSLQVANLAEGVIREIGGETLLVRVGALYHDIGKMKAPHYFTENQKGAVNPHSELSYDDSAKIIINHIADGIEMAKENKLPDQIIDFIRTHHGTTTARYFFAKQKLDFPELDVNELDFKYPGPLPYSKETAVLMMADSVEAASRSLLKYDEETIDIFVENIIENQIQEMQYINTPITFRDVTIAKKIFKKQLMNIYHVRIAYPQIQ